MTKNIDTQNIYPKDAEHVGDRITIDFQGHKITGTVLSAFNHGTPDEPNWYIEWKNEEQDLSGYWKQALDGGYLVGHDYFCPEHDEYYAFNGECEGCGWDSEADLRAAESGQLLEESNDRWASDDDPRSF